MDGVDVEGSDINQGSDKVVGNDDMDDDAISEFVMEPATPRSSMEPPQFYPPPDDYSPLPSDNATPLPKSLVRNVCLSLHHLHYQNRCEPMWDSQGCLTTQ